jgi:hypothetical protein
MGKIHNHGDLILRPIDGKTPPADTTVATVGILQDSGVTGNRHEVYSKTASIARWTEDGHEYLYCPVPFVLRHVGGDCEHGEQAVEAGAYEVLHEEEYNPWAKELRRVID